MGCRPSRFLTGHLNSTASSLCFSSIILGFTKNIGSKRASVPRLSAPKSASDRPPPRRPLSCPEHFVVFCAPPPGIKSSETRRSRRAGWTPRRRFPQTSRCLGNGPVWQLEGSRLTELKTMIPHPRDTATTDNAQRRELLAVSRSGPHRPPRRRTSPSCPAQRSKPATISATSRKPLTNPACPASNFICLQPPTSSLLGVQN